MCLFDSFAIVNAYIAWRNHILKDKPEEQRKWEKYGVREARLKLITLWAKRCGRHYEKMKPHKNKRLRRVITHWFYKDYLVWCMSWRACLSSLVQSIIMSPWEYQLDLRIVSSVVWKRGRCVGDAPLILAMCFPFVPLPSETVSKLCIICGTRFECIVVRYLKYVQLEIRRNYSKFIP